MADARQRGEFIEGMKIAYMAGGVSPGTRGGRSFVGLDKDVYARALRPMRVAAGPPVAPQVLDAREADGSCDTHQPDKLKPHGGAHRHSTGILKGNAKVTVTMAKGSDVRR
jgi:hypothetical protein